MRKLTKKDISEIVAEWRQSGLSQAEFCRQKSISASSLYNWLSKSRRELTKVKNADPDFIEILSPLRSANNTRPQVLRLTTSYGMTLEIPL